MNENISNSSDLHAPVVRIAVFRFYEELNDFLPDEWKKKKFPFSFTGTPSVKNTIEAIGVPHSEIDLILVNGKSVDFEFLLKGDENISVYPVFESFDISPLIRLRAKPLRKVKFIVDVNLGKLARKLRLRGFDTLFQQNFDDDDEIVKIAVQEKRIILTRDKGVLKHTRVTHGYWLRSADPKQQLNEVIGKFQLQNSFNPFSRCSNCNGKLKPVEKSKLNGRIPNDTIQIFDTFWECNNCAKIYWEGSHFDKINTWLNNLNGE